MKKTIRVFLSVLLILSVGLSVSAAEITVTYMQAGTYDKAAELIKPDFEEKTGIKVELVAAPWAVLNQNHITDLTTGTGEFDVMSGEFWIASVFGHMLPLDEFGEIFGLKDLPAGGTETLGGLVMTILGRIPSAGDCFKWQGLRVEVLDMDGRRVDKVLVIPEPAAPDGDVV